MLLQRKRAERHRTRKKEEEIGLVNISIGCSSKPRQRIRAALKICFPYQLTNLSTFALVVAASRGIELEQPLKFIMFKENETSLCA